MEAIEAIEDFLAVPACPILPPGMSESHDQRARRADIRSTMSNVAICIEQKQTKETKLPILRFLRCLL
jgi:hypothetical protein